MSKFIKQEVQEIAISGIRQFNQKAEDVEGVIKLTLGELDFNTFDHIKEGVSWAAEHNKTRYTPNAGLDALRKKISYRYEHYNAEEVIVTVGTTEGISIIVKSCIGKGDEVIIPTPGYVGYEPLIKIEQATVREIDLSTSDFRITKEQLETAYNENTKAILITNPNNPTGKVLTMTEMDYIKDFVLKYDLLLIVDEVYSEIVFDGTFTSFSVYSELKDNMVLLDGFSKSHAMTGFRIGYIVADILMIRQLLKTHQYSVTSATSLSQYAALAAKDEDSLFLVQELRKRRDFLCQELDRLGLAYVYPEGAFYVFVNIAEYSSSSIAFCERLLYTYKVATIPGESFLGHHNDYIRISYALPLEELAEAMKRIESFLKEKR
ncbi:pyridoxal phosphate-dependent aminotransferase [Candidatus Xianfuyuplasma coldseepsis]|uniref:Aminotransferase n=1 Tax=Candidatus Xianfuyuplasma coldseepsis TaxID=2782163 RepID=A0A7L7KRL7_9MOLU|nr:aminotransferase class I/II-fold pyridoxal phosphate-dependent enzyme [Xianfuyuplasma coldseepsis]QMS84594.1 aminotransferase class I/II-fold pyridoxal phosphate-dependent enzyme [Xianfuyuplasma coldseepsis]